MKLNCSLWQPARVGTLGRTAFIRTYDWQCNSGSSLSDILRTCLLDRGTNNTPPGIYGMHTIENSGGQWFGVYYWDLSCVTPALCIAPDDDSDASIRIQSGNLNFSTWPPKPITPIGR